MPSSPPGEPAPLDGVLPSTARQQLGARPFGIYVHVPFCARRCGYCDFNTYTAADLGGTAAGAVSRSTFAELAIAEIRYARQVLAPVELPVDTVFFGGGTPTLLPAGDLAKVVRCIAEQFGVSRDAEVTVEANPDSVDKAALSDLREGGINRISFGMQSAVPHVLATLDRTHRPERVPDVVGWARDVGFDQVSLDLIYGTPGESVEDWQTSLAAALSLQPDHLSAYALIVEAGTALARRVQRGETPTPDDDDLADKYVVADEMLDGAGLRWYEVSNWAIGPSAHGRHNLGYWLGSDWWGAGPGAHSHVGGVRWWNVQHPVAYAERLRAGQSPALGREVLDADTQRVERVMLETRLATGLPLHVLDEPGQAAAERAVDEGLAEGSALSLGRLVLTRRGRLLADAVVRSLLG